MCLIMLLYVNDKKSLSVKIRKQGGIKPPQPRSPSIRNDQLDFKLKLLEMKNILIEM